MKKLFTSAYLLFSLTAFSQGCYQIVDTTKIWNTIGIGYVSWGVIGCSGTKTTQFTDAFTPGDQYLDVMECMDSLLQVWDFVGNIREDTNTRQVFFRRSDEEGLIYDFNLHVGDTVQPENLYINYALAPLVCDSIDQVNMNGVLRNRFYLFGISRTVEDSYYPNEIWIEGIGSNYGILYSGFGSVPVGGGTVSMLCCSQNGSTIYMDSMFNKCYYDTFYPQIIQDKYDTAYHGSYYEFKVLVDTGDASAIELIGEVIPDGFSFDASTGLLTGSPLQPGTFTCVITAKNLEWNALTDMIYEDIIVMEPSEIPESESPGIPKVYPNPFYAQLNVEPAKSDNKPLLFELFSFEGKLMRKISITITDKFDLSSLRNGLYLAKITDYEGKVLLIEKLLKQ